MVVDDLKSKGVTPIYLVTDYTSFYERYSSINYMICNDEEI